MLKAIYTKRYGKALVAAILVILGVFALQTTSIVRTWHSNHEWLHSAQFKKEFMMDPKAYGDYDYDKKGNEIVNEYTLEEYIEKESYLFMDDSSSSVGPEELIPANLSYMRYGSSSFIVATVIVALCGFLLFFVDQKTSFNRFLFSLGVSRKQLFKGKLLYGAVPLFAAFVLGLLGSGIGLWLGIPHPYLNISFVQLVSSGLMGLVTCLFYFGISCFCGVMLGNLVFGPVVYALLLWSLQLLPNMLGGLSELIYYLMHHKYLPNRLNYFYGNGFPRLYTFDLRKDPFSWPAPVLLLLVSGLLLFWAYRKYQTLSLEHDGEFLLYPESRWPIWSLAVLYLTLFAIFGYAQVWSPYIYDQLDPEIGWDYSFTEALGTSIFLLVVAMAVSTLLLFFGPLTKWLREKWAQRNHKLIEK
ncbi:hypothetical protein ABQD61_02395 [Enterococcus asini]|uniref:hypothetical protein n=1 Tax=Enterococcus asini TaxID=57732 RepID=UPI0032E44CD4